MLQNDWLLKREAEERINTRLHEAETFRLAQQACQAQPQGWAYQHALVHLGEWMSKAGNYLQSHFGAGLQVEPDCFSAVVSPKK